MFNKLFCLFFSPGRPHSFFWELFSRLFWNFTHLTKCSNFMALFGLLQMAQFQKARNIQSFVLFVSKYDWSTTSDRYSSDSVFEPDLWKSRMNPPPQNVLKLKKAIWYTWTTFPQIAIQRLTQSMPRWLRRGSTSSTLTIHVRRYFDGCIQNFRH